MFRQAAPAVWRGSVALFGELRMAAGHNCTCDEPGWRRCRAHLMLLDQESLNRLLWWRMQGPRLFAEEMHRVPWRVDDAPSLEPWKVDESVSQDE